MKIKRRIMALLLSAAMILTYLPAMAFAEGSENNGGEVLNESVEPVSAVEEGFLRGVIGSGELENLTPGAQRFVVTFSDGSEKVYIYNEQYYKTEGTVSAFVYSEDPNAYEDIDLRTADNYLYAMVNDEEGQISFKEGWNRDVKLKLIVHYVASGEGTEDAVTATKVLYANADVLCAYDRKPLSFEFLPAKGFSPNIAAGCNYLTEADFYGKGNAFKVTYRGWEDGEGGGSYITFTRTYYYTKGENSAGKTVEGFFYKGKVDEESFVFDEGVLCELRYGKKVSVEFSYSEYVAELGKTVSVKGTIPVKATRYEPYADWPILAYNGKVKTVSAKTFKVYDNDDKLIPSKYYTVKQAKKTGKMGWYKATITFKKSVRSKYGKSIIAYYGIGPAKPTFNKVTAGNKRLTVSWKKFSKAKLKKIDGMYIELATDKNFVRDYKRVRISKKILKKGVKTIKGLKKGKKYYVRMYTYKNITQSGEKFTMPSRDSKIVTRKTK